MERIDRNDMEELLFAIEHAAHAEYHLVEVIMNNFMLYVDQNRDYQTFINDQLYTLREVRRSLMRILETKRPNVGPLWCTLKHMLLLHFHLIELFEKSYDDIYLSHASKIWDDIGNLLKQEGAFDNYKHCAICNQDRIDNGGIGLQHSGS